MSRAAAVMRPLAFRVKVLAYSSTCECVGAHQSAWHCPAVTGRGLDVPPATASVAVLADVYGNVVALEAVLREVLAIDPDVVVFLGDLTCGPLPEETWRAVRLFCAHFEGTVRFVRGNRERAMIEAAAGLQQGNGEITARRRWLVEAHAPATHEAIEAFESAVFLEVAGLGAVRFCHGSPRSDEEMITPATPVARMQALAAGVDERVLVSAHTHIQFDRTVVGIRSISPGSIGLPYEGRRGAFWALLGAQVELCHTTYDVDLAVARFRESTDPFAQAIVDMLLDPPARAEVITHAESLVYSS
jgi:predicted phosphodiesterase